MFSSLDDHSSIRYQFFQSPEVIERNLNTVLAVNPSGNQEPTKQSYVPPVITPRQGPILPDKPDHVIGQDFPRKTSGSRFGSTGNGDPGGSGGSSGSGNSNSDDPSKNVSPSQSNWQSDPKVWNHYQQNLNEDEETCPVPNIEEDDLDLLKTKTIAGVHVDFPYKLDQNDNPTFFVRNFGKFSQRKYTKVEYEQTLTHLHHAKDFGIVLPANFDLSEYESLTNSDRILYAKQKNFPKELAIKYQNNIAKSLRPEFNPANTACYPESPGNVGRFGQVGSTLEVPGLAGINATSTTLIFQMDKKNHYTMGVIREDGTHISSYSITSGKLKKIADNKFWIWPERAL